MILSLRFKTKVDVHGLLEAAKVWAVTSHNKPMKDSGDKQGKVLVKDGDKIAVVRFGDPSMPDNQSEEDNDNFYARFGNQKGIDDKFSPLYWSARWLWPRGEMKGKGAKEFFKLK